MKSGIKSLHTILTLHNFQAAVTQLVSNSLPAAVREADSLYLFKCKLRTHLFTLCFNDRLSVFTNFSTGNAFPVRCRVRA